jgi:uncharacterized protein involved in type VI secretion and phage assembly
VELDLIGLLEGNVAARDVAAGGGRPRVAGVLPGVVTNVTDRSGLARVKVRFTFAGRVESAWARVAAAWAGNRRGTYFVPEVDDEVLVAFRDGLLAHPYVLGFLWSDPNARPPETGPEARRSTMRSATGHRVVFDEGKGKEAISIESARGHRVVLADGRDASDIELRVAGGSGTITLNIGADNNATISISAPKGTVAIDADKITVKAKSSLALEGQRVSITGHQVVDINPTGG